jgi:hypothetical protein
MYLLVLQPVLSRSLIMDFGIVKMLVAYLTASVGALVTSVKVACALGGHTMVIFGGNYFG